MSPCSRNHFRNLASLVRLQIAQSGVGVAVVLAHIALVAGFMVLTVSEFIPLVYFGALLSLSMIGGLISDLILLPLLLRWTTKDPKQTGDAVLK